MENNNNKNNLQLVPIGCSPKQDKCTATKEFHFGLLDVSAIFTGFIDFIEFKRASFSLL